MVDKLLLFAHAAASLQIWNGAPAMTIAIGRDDEINLHLLQVDGSYATRLWGSSIGLARWLTEDFEVLNATEIALELGCGSGLVSLALAKVGAAQKVVATDIDSSSLALIQQASMLNHVQISTELLNICGAEPLPSADIVVASDVLYTESLAEGLAARCIEALDAGSQVVIGDPGRPGRRTLIEALMAAGEGFISCSGERRFVDWFEPNAERRRTSMSRSERLLLLHVDARSEEEAFEALGGRIARLA